MHYFYAKHGRSLGLEVCLGVESWNLEFVSQPLLYAIRMKTYPLRIAAWLPVK